MLETVKSLCSSPPPSISTPSSLSSPSLVSLLLCVSRFPHAYIHTFHTSRAAVSKGDVTEMQTGVLAHEQTAARSVVRVVGTSIHKREAYDADIGYAVGNAKVPEKGTRSQNETSIFCSASAPASMLSLLSMLKHSAAQQTWTGAGSRLSSRSPPRLLLQG